jgi:parvulin-like peptidyl-prolyl isomerase
MKRHEIVFRAPLLTMALLIAGGGALRAQQGTTPPAPTSPVIARVEGRSITQEDFDRIAQPYLERLRAEMGPGFNAEVRQHANYNVIQELIRREVLVVEAQRQKIPITEVDTDRILKQDPFFLTNGQFDPNKFLQYKLNPQTNYLTVLPRIRDLAAAGKMDSITRAKLTPPAATVKAEWTKRSDQVQFDFLHLSQRDVSLEPEATPSEWAAYYAAHPDQFERKARARLRYVKLPVPPEGDGAREKASSAALARGRGLADSLKRGVAIDSLGPGLDVLDTGILELPPTTVPGLGRVPELVDQLTDAATDTTRRVIDPVLVRDGVVVGTLSERSPKTLPAMREIMPDVKRRADAETRRMANEREKREFYEARTDSYRTSRIGITRVLLEQEQMPMKVPSRKDMEKWYAEHGRTLAFPGDSAPLPAFNDSIRLLVRDKMIYEGQVAEAERRLAKVAEGWRAGKDVRPLAKSARAAVETLSIVRTSISDSIFLRNTWIDMFSRGPQSVGTIEGPKGFGNRMALWRIDTFDTTIVPALQDMQAIVDRDFTAHKHAEEEADGRAWFEAHRSDYRTKPKFVVDYIRLRIPPPDSVQLSDAELQASYRKNIASYRDEEQVRARHILIGTRGGLTDDQAKARVDSVRGAILGGADFADLARRYSDDPGSGSQGGDLGFFPRGRMVPGFSDTSFALPIGRVSQPVKTQFGYHLIRVDEKKPATTKPFEEVRDDVRRKLAVGRGDSLTYASAQSMRRRIAKGEPVATVAKPAGGVTTSAPFADNEPIPGVGMIQGLGPLLDSLKVGGWGPRPLKTSDAYLLVRLEQKVPVTQATFDEVRNQAIEDAKNGKRREILVRKVAGYRDSLKAGVVLDSLAIPYGGLKNSGPLSQSSGFVPFLGAEPRMITKAFAMKQGQVSDSIATAQGFAWIKVTGRKTVEGASFAKDKAAITQELLQKKYEDWLDAKKKSMRVEILRADLREKPKPITQTFSVGGR